MIVYIKGSDSFLAREAILAIKKKYLAKNPEGVELIEIDADTPMINWADLQAVPLFATSRLIIIKRICELLVDEQASLASILTDLPETSVVVVWDGKPLKTNTTLSHISDKANKIILAEPLVGLGLKNWIKGQATKIGLELSPEAVTDLVDQYGSDLWAISTDLKTRQSGTNTSSWGVGLMVKPFVLFDYIRTRRWPVLKRHLITSLDRGEAAEMTIGSLAAAVRKSNFDRDLKLKITDILSDIDLALKSGLVESADAIALLVCYLPGNALTRYGDSQKRVQWENQYDAIN